MNHFILLLAQVTGSERSICEGQRGVVVAVSQEMALEITGDAEGPSLAGNQPHSSEVKPGCASPSLYLSVPEPFIALEFPSTESKAGTEVVKKKMLFAM